MSHPFLDAEASKSALLRAFFVPRLSEKSNVFLKYHLLRRRKVSSSGTEATSAASEEIVEVGDNNKEL